jgi:hypothetical protein
MALMVLSACSKQATPTPTSTPTIANAIAKVSPAVVRVIGENKEGSGMVIDKGGYALTNNHVVEGSESATIVLPDGQRLQCAVIGTDEIKDLAMVKFKGSNLPVVTLGNSGEVKAGEEVIAIGFPLALGGSATASKGIVSSLQADEETGITYIQTDAAINPGNSGGPLINIKGEVIGINAWKYVGEAIEGMNFAIAIDSIRPAIPVLMAGKSIPVPTPAELWKTFANDAYGYTISYPGSWQMQVLDKGGCNIYSEKARMNISIPVGCLNPTVGKYTLDEWVNLTIKRHTELEPYFEVVSDRKVMHQELEGRETVWLSQCKPDSPQWKVKNFWVIVESGWIYQIQCWAEKADYDHYCTIFDKAIASFHPTPLP